ncbi:MAG: hypothetical protein DRQ55_03105 [Planctomycetota bacterium]|nr:MAG: hypothetical protein DRQ55_03105 [Planctomycetota bacterium]
MSGSGVERSGESEGESLDESLEEPVEEPVGESVEESARERVTERSAPPLAPRPPSALVVTLLLALLSVVWGSTWLVIKQGLVDLPPFLGLGLRFCLAGLVMAAIAPAIRRREGGTRPGWGLTLVVAIAEFGVSYGIVYRAELVVSSGLVAVLWAVYPLLMALCGHLAIPGERLPARAWAGFSVGFGGVVLLFFTDLANAGPAAWGWGAAVIFGAGVVALGTTVLKLRAHGASSALLNRNGMLFSGPMFLALWFWLERDLPWQLTGQALFSVVYLAVMGTVVTFGVYFWLLRHVAAFRLSLIAYVIPLVALLLGVLFGDESVGPSTLAGTALILLGVAAGVRGSDRRRAHGDARGD